MKSLTVMSLLLSSALMFSSHPLFLISIISTQTLIIALILTLMTPSSWFSFILFLVFMGGLMVLFIYVSSLASNEKFNSNLNQTSLLPPTLIICSIAAAFPMMTNSQSAYFFSLSPQTLIFKTYLTSNMSIISLTMSYLLLTLIVIVSTTLLKTGPLRQFK